MTISMATIAQNTHLPKVQNAEEDRVGRWNDDSEADRFTTTKNNSKHWKKLFQKKQRLARVARLGASVRCHSCPLHVKM